MGLIRTSGTEVSAHAGTRLPPEVAEFTDLVSLAASVSQGEELGTSMGDVLRIQAEELRAMRAQRARERAQRAPVLMTIPLVIFFLPAMGAVVIVPAILNLVDFINNGLSGA